MSAHEGHEGAFVTNRQFYEELMESERLHTAQLHQLATDFNDKLSEFKREVRDAAKQRHTDTISWRQWAVTTLLAAVAALAPVVDIIIRKGTG